jgi:carbonyl reductase 1
LAVNYWGVKRVTEELLRNDLIPDHSRIIIMSSVVSLLERGNEPKLQVFKHIDSLTEEKLDQLVKEFTECCQHPDQLERNGWSSNTYRMSKIAVNAYGRLLAKRLEKRAITVNTCSSGWCQKSSIIY